MKRRGDGGVGRRRKEMKKQEEELFLRAVLRKQL